MRGLTFLVFFAGLVLVDGFVPYFAERGISRFTGTGLFWYLLALGAILLAFLHIRRWGKTRESGARAGVSDKAEVRVPETAPSPEGRSAEGGEPAREAGELEGTLQPVELRRRRDGRGIADSSNDGVRREGGVARGEVDLHTRPGR